MGEVHGSNQSSMASLELTLLPTNQVISFSLGCWYHVAPPSLWPTMSPSCLSDWGLSYCTWQQWEAKIWGKGEPGESSVSGDSPTVFFHLFSCPVDPNIHWGSSLCCKKKEAENSNIPRSQHGVTLQGVSLHKMPFKPIKNMVSTHALRQEIKGWN